MSEIVKAQYQMNKIAKVFLNKTQDEKKAIKSELDKVFEDAG